MIDFHWTTSNVNHIAEHEGITPAEAESVVRRPAKGYPVSIHDDKILARGKAAGGRYIQVIYVNLDDAEVVDFSTVDLVALLAASEAYYVVHS